MANEQSELQPEKKGLIQKLAESRLIEGKQLTSTEQQIGRNRWGYLFTGIVFGIVFALPSGYLLGVRSNFVVTTEDEVRSLISSNITPQKPHEIILSAECVPSTDPLNPDKDVHFSVDTSHYTPVDGGVVLVAEPGLSQPMFFHVSPSLYGKNRGLLPTDKIQTSELQKMGGLKLSIYHERQTFTDVTADQFHPSIDLEERLGYLTLSPTFCN